MQHDGTVATSGQLRFLLFDGLIKALTLFDGLIKALTSVQMCLLKGRRSALIRVAPRRFAR